jgi:hypothetical protein
MNATARASVATLSFGLTPVFLSNDLDRDGPSPAVIPAMLRDDIWEVYDALDRSRSR